MRGPLLGVLGGADAGDGGGTHRPGIPQAWQVGRGDAADGHGRQVAEPDEAGEPGVAECGRGIRLGPGRVQRADADVVDACRILGGGAQFVGGGGAQAQDRVLTDQFAYRGRMADPTGRRGPR